MILDIHPILLYFLIFIAKVIEVTIAVFRTVLITKGERKVATLVAFFEVILWVIITAAVLDNIIADPFKVLFYSAGFAVGQYLGSWLEDKVGLGSIKMEIIIPFECGDALADHLRDNGYAVTELIAEGKQKTRKKILILYLNRKDHKKITKIIKEYTKNAVITVLDAKPVYGGYRRIIK